MRVPLGRIALLAALVLGACSCSAVYPELSSPLRTPASQKLIPPPDDIRYAAFVGASVPPQTRDGRKWDAIGGELPDPYAILFADGREVLRTAAQSDTLAPTWPDAVKGNFRLSDSQRLRIELWDANPVNDHPIGVKDLGLLSDLLRDKNVIDVECDSGAHVRIKIEPAHAHYGLGLLYELRNGAVFLTRVLERSPAGRAGLRSGDELVSIGTAKTSVLSPAEIQSAINAVALDGLALVVRHENGREQSMRLADGAVYLLVGELSISR